MNMVDQRSSLSRVPHDECRLGKYASLKWLSKLSSSDESGKRIRESSKHLGRFFHFVLSTEE